jgi:hypothetical protein
MPHKELWLGNYHPKIIAEARGLYQKYFIRIIRIFLVCIVHVGQCSYADTTVKLIMHRLEIKVNNYRQEITTEARGFFQKIL